MNRCEGSGNQGGGVTARSGTRSPVVGGGGTLKDPTTGDGGTFKDPGGTAPGGGSFKDPSGGNPPTQGCASVKRYIFVY
jgi:hypothetical protein